jgi:hypothetical protein
MEIFIFAYAYAFGFRQNFWWTSGLCKGDTPISQRQWKGKPICLEKPLGWVAGASMGCLAWQKRFVLFLHLAGLEREVWCSGGVVSQPMTWVLMGRQMRRLEEERFVLLIESQNV